MSLYRHVAAALAAVVIMSPVFAEGALSTTTTPIGKTPGQQAVVQAKLNLNTATGKELVRIKGLTPGKARAIIAYRKKHGNFTSLEDLGKVKSVAKLKPEEVKQIQDQLSI